MTTLMLRLMDGDYPVPGLDSGEHTPGLRNVTAFSLYHSLSHLSASGDTPNQPGVLATLDERALAVTRQLYGEVPLAGDGSSNAVAERDGEFARDYEQLLRKLPQRPKSVFPPHWDQMYWPKSASGRFDTRTATFSLALNEADEENGCLWVLPGSHKLRGSYSGSVSRITESRDTGGGAIDLQLLPDDVPRCLPLPLAAGDATFHEEWIIHGSQANCSADRSRDTLIFAYRTRGMIGVERSLGFRHSYNDDDQVLRSVRETLQP